MQQVLKLESVPPRSNVLIIRNPKVVGCILCESVFALSVHDCMEVLKLQLKMPAYWN
ncbi:hypothetical protein [Anabaena azotica]|uniref:Uncharacterized protein n=1 Tax=Anabaena azotica FACHB-119 TaxID=947527 RepID=A0ABR8D7Q2_9NOST|nr:hypothetical protein [Anabaena azotica]MBD2503192.1 hypothetical protein [Anabaena azotica FACHB-119]